MLAECVIADINYRKQAEAALQNSEELAAPGNYQPQTRDLTISI